jgi:hypothetical protein
MAASRYTKKLGLQVCEMISEGKTFVDIEQTEGLPTRKTLNNWLEKNDEFRVMYFNTLRDKCVGLMLELDNLTNKDNWPTLETMAQGNPMADAKELKIYLAAEISRRKLRIDMLKTVLTKVAAKFVPELETKTKIEHEHTGKVDTGQPQIVVINYKDVEIPQLPLGRTIDVDAENKE